MTDDPFEVWRRTMQQWTGGEAPDPTALGPTGWPMFPFPNAGVTGGEDALSPAVGTKTAVRQLYRTLDELDAHGVGAGGGLGAGAGFPGAGGTDLFSAYREAMGFGPDDEGESGAGPQVGSMLVGTYLVWLYSLGQLLLESYAMRLVHDEVVVADHRGTADTLEWLLGQSQAEREELLRRSTDVDDDLIDEMAAIRARRNDLVFNLGRWDAVDVDDPVGDARAFLAVLRALDERATDREPFRYLPGSDEGGDNGGQGDGEEGHADDEAA